MPVVVAATILAFVLMSHPAVADGPAYQTVSLVVSHGPVIAMQWFKDQWVGHIFIPEAVPDLVFHIETVDDHDTIQRWGDPGQWKNDAPTDGIAISGLDPAIRIVNPERGSYYQVRFDEATRAYLVVAAVFEDFDHWDNNTHLFTTGAKNVGTTILGQDFEAWPRHARALEQDFSSPLWTNQHYGYFTEDGWAMVGRVTGADPRFETPPDRAADDMGWVRPVRAMLLDGVGDIRCDYRLIDGGDGSPVSFIVALVDGDAYEYYGNDPELGWPDMSKWTVLTNAIGVTNLDYQTLELTIQTNATRYVVIRQTFGANALAFDNIRLTNWRARNLSTNGWMVSQGWIDGDDGSAWGGGTNMLEFRNSRALFHDAQSIQSPLAVHGVGRIEFDVRNGIDDRAVSWRLERTLDTNTNIWQTVRQVADAVPNTWSNVSVAINTTAPVYLRLVHTSPNTNDAVLLLDNLRVIPYTQGLADQNWTAYNVSMAADQWGADRRFRGVGQSAHLNNSPTADTSDGPFHDHYPYVQTPRLEHGVGEIGFWYRSWGGDANLQILLSPTGTNQWTPLTNLTVNNTTFEPFRLEIHDTSNRFVRIANATNTPTARLAIDEFYVTRPMSVDLVMTNAATLPEAPLFSDAVQLEITLTRFFRGPLVTSVEAFWFDGTNQWGTWADANTLTMELVASNVNVRPAWYTYRTTGSIPAREIDDTVQYRFRAAFDGPFSYMTSPKDHRGFANPAWYEPTDYNTRYGDASNRIPYYIVFSCQPGAVWINEINVIDWIGGLLVYTNEYVELAGPAGINIENWSIENVDVNGQFVTAYTVTNNWALPNDINAFGFWVLGDEGVAGRDQTLTNAYGLYDPEQHLARRGGLTLRRSMGAYEYRIGYNLDSTYLVDHLGFENAGADLFYAIGSLQLAGEGNVYSNFYWAFNTTFTAGAVNPDQALLGGIGASPWIRTDAAVNLQERTATLEANLLSTGGSDTHVWIYWGTDDGGTNRAVGGPSQWSHVEALGIQAMGSVAAPVTGLEPGTLYYYRAYATNTTGQAWASTAAAFTTKAIRYARAESGVGTPPYTSWGTASSNLHAVLAVANDGDLVLVSNGVYTVGQEIAITNAVTVRSINGSAVTHVSGGGVTRVFRLAHSNAVIDGLTIRDGHAEGWGGGVYFDPDGSGGTLQNSIVTNNYVEFDWIAETALGGGVYLHGAAAGTWVVRNVLVAHNTAELYGGGIYAENHATIQNCSVLKNQAHLSDPVFTTYAGGLLADGAGVLVENTLVFHNQADLSDDLYQHGDYGAPTVHYSAAPGLAGNHNVSEPPTFVDMAAGDFRLSAGDDETDPWPGIDGGIDRPWMIDALDLAGQKRIMGERVDIGAYEYHDHRKLLTVGGTFTVLDKVYDRDLAATIDANELTLEGIEDGDGVTLTPVAVFATRTAGEDKWVQLSAASILGGADAHKYALSLDGSPTTTANITPKPLTLVGLTAADKTHDGTTNARITDYGTLDGIVGEDAVTPDTHAAVATFDTADVGEDKKVTVTGLALAGADAGNYRIADQETTATIIHGTALGTPIAWYQRYGIEPEDGHTWDDVDYYDTDEDGMLNWQEYLAGTDPTDPESVLRFERVSRQAISTLELIWHGGTNGPATPYRILVTTNLADGGDWLTVTNQPRQTGSHAWTNPAPFGHRAFFRIQAD